MSAGQGYEFTPFGIVPIGSAVNAGDQVSGGVVPVQVTQQAQISKPSVDKPAVAVTGKVPLTGKQIAVMVKARLKELDKILASVPALERERASLKALLAAASPIKRRKGIQ